ncbi:hypothetical protein F5Y10DRAFT_264842 [Nemania abortiva]|nr:hypothetical protein F5Y10DRAFT_264842 [Nemania abortiva]
MNRARRNWTAKEDSLLRQLVQNELDNKRPLLWRELAKHVSGRSNKDCRKRWWNSLAGSTAKGVWSPEEDRRLIEAVEKYGENWMKVAGAVGTRCGDQCSGHWRHVLNPNINYSDWTREEDEQLLEAVRVHGTNWSTIASFHTPQRTTLALKNQYWKLRQRSENASKILSTKPSSPATPLTTTASSTVLAKTVETNRMLCSSSDEVESDEEGDRNEESESEEPNMDVSAAHADGYYQVEWLGDDWTDKTELQRKPVSPKLPPPPAPRWAGYHHKGSSSGTESPEDAWMEGVANPGMSGDSGAMALYSQDGLLGAVAPDGGKQCTILPSERHNQLPRSSADDEAINLFFADLDSISHQNSLITGSNWAGSVPPGNTTTSPAVVDMLNLVNQSDPGEGDLAHLMASPGLETLVGDTSPQPKAAEPLSHSVSIRFSCTTGQLSDVMSLLANIGLPINIKIDTE